MEKSSEGAGGVVEYLDCSTAKEFFECLHTIQSSMMNHHERGLFRGMSNADWGLVPSAFRASGRARLMKILAITNADPFGKEPNNLSQITAEFAAIRHFYTIANDQGLPLPDVGNLWHHALLQAPLGMTRTSFIGLMNGRFQQWPPPELRPVIALAQHYGVPTRLLDWSCDYRVASYFAAVSALMDNKNDADRLAVWALGRAAIESTNSAFALPGVDDLSYQLDVVEAQYAGNPNLAAQKGAFTLVTPTKKQQQANGSLTDYTTIDAAFKAMRDESIGTEYGNIVFKRFKMERYVNPFIKLTLPVSAAKDLLKTIRYHGFGGARLFPGYKGCEIAISELELTASVS